MCGRRTKCSRRGSDGASLAAGIGVGLIVGLLAGRWSRNCTRCGAGADGWCRCRHCRRRDEGHPEGDTPANET